MGISNLLTSITSSHYRTVAGFAVIFAFVAAIYFRRKIIKFPYYKEVWGTLGVLWCCFMSSGQMWNRIRRPHKYHLQDNVPFYFSGNTTYQFIYESYLVAGIFAATAFSMILLIEAAGGLKKMPLSKGRRVLCTLALISICVFFSIPLMRLKSKKRYYPYSFLFNP